MMSRVHAHVTTVATAITHARVTTVIAQHSTTPHARRTRALSPPSPILLVILLANSHDSTRSFPKTRNVQCMGIMIRLLMSYPA